MLFISEPLHAWIVKVTEHANYVLSITIRLSTPAWRPRPKSRER